MGDGLLGKFNLARRGSRRPSGGGKAGAARNGNALGPSPAPFPSGSEAPFSALAKVMAMKRPPGATVSRTANASASPPPSVRGETSTPRAGAVPPEPFTALAADGFPVKGFFWRHAGVPRGARPVVIVNPATSVRCRYYFRFALFLFEHGFDAIVFDYRGIGESRPATLRGFDASWIDWGRLDFDAVLRYAARSFPGQPVDVAAHSVGGFVLGLAESNPLIRRVFTMGAQYAHWRDYAPGARLRMLSQWHVAMPLLTLLFGYFPGKRLGWLEDTPKGVVRDWVFSRARFEDTWRGSASARYPDRSALVQQFAAVTAPTLAVSVTDDEFGTVPAVERLLAYFSGSPRTHLRISPQSIVEPAIGHFGFFNSRFEGKLWRVPLEWLRSGRLPADCPGVVIPRGWASLREGV